MDGSGGRTTVRRNASQRENRLDPQNTTERLRRLLGDPSLAELRRRLRARYERGQSRDTFTLSQLNAAERRALEGLLGRKFKTAESMRLRAAELDEAISRAALAPDLRTALELLDGPIEDRKAQRFVAEESWRTALSTVADPSLAAWVSMVAGAGLLKRLSGSDPARAQSLLAQAESVLANLPGRGISLAQLAAEVLGDSHALDVGRPVATIVLRACGPGPSSEARASSSDIDEPLRERWARLGVAVNALALPALCLNLPAQLGLSAPGEPVHVSLRRLLRRPPMWDVAGRDVFVCENPNIVAIAADRLGSDCAALVCTDGMPAAAQQTMLGQLATAGARLRYHGDFDWAGINIGNFVMREFSAEPWRFGTNDYLSVCTGHELALRADEYIEARWDDRLAGVMTERRAVVHEEATVEILLTELAVGR